MAKNIYNAVRGAAEAQTGRVFKNAVGILKKSAIDTIRGGKKGGASNDVANAVGGKYSTQNLTFPLDLEGPTGANGNQGHYIQFFVNEQSDEVIDYQDSRKKLGGGLTSAATDDPAIAAIVNPKGNKPAKKASVKNNSLSIKRKATVRMPVSICMYMPPSVDVKYGVDYQDTEIGTATAMAAGVVQDVMAGQGVADTVISSVSNNAGALGDGATRMGMATIDLTPGAAGSNAVFEMQRGFIKAPRMELAFKGIPKRDFSYEFKMMPKSAAEAEMAKNIIKTFKMYMLPEIKSAASMQLTMPATFDIQYMHLDKENMNLNKIGTCVLTNMDVKYGGDKYKTHADAVPVESSMTLSFKELDLVTREKAEQGF